MRLTLFAVVLLVSAFSFAEGKIAIYEGTNLYEPCRITIAYGDNEQVEAIVFDGKYSFYKRPLLPEWMRSSSEDEGHGTDSGTLYFDARGLKVEDIVTNFPYRVLGRTYGSYYENRRAARVSDTDRFKPETIDLQFFNRKTIIASCSGLRAVEK